MIELDSLKFTVDTAELVNAVTKVQDLQKAVTQLNKPLVENAKISAKVAAENAKVAVAEEKVAQAKAKTAEAENKANAAKVRAEKASAAVVRGMQEEITYSQRLTYQLEYMAKGFSTSQSNRLAILRSQGEEIEELAKVMTLFNQMTRLKGGDNLDKSLSGTRSLKNALRELRIENELVNRGIELSSKQYKELARERARVIEAAKIEGKSYTEIKELVKSTEQRFVQLAYKVNELTEAEKARERAQRDVLNATRAIAAEDEKMASIVATYNAAQNDGISIHDRAARSIAVYERNLRVAGVSAEVAAAKLATYRKNVMMVQEAEQKRRVEMLSRALAPQISDVVVSLASGMNPFTVMLQQGLQVRDLIGQSQVEASKLGESFRGAGKDIVSSLKGTAAALSSMLVGAIQDAGFAFYKFSKNISGDQSLQEYRNRLLALNGLMGETPKEIRAVDAAIKTLGVIGTFAITSIIVSMVMLGKVLYEAIKQEREFSKAIATTGATLGLTFSTAYEYAKSLEAVGVKTGDATKALAEISKNGRFAADSLDEIVVSAVALEKSAGVSIAETIKNFAKLRDEPLKAVIELGKQTGYFSEEVLRSISELEKQGRSSEAARLAMQEYAKGTKQSADTIKENYGTLERLAFGIANAFKSMWDTILGLGRRETDTKVLEERLANARKMAEGDSTGFYAMQVEIIESQLRQIKALDDQAKARQRNVEQAELLGQLEGIRQKNLSASQKYQQESNRLIQLEEDLKARNLFTAEAELAIQKDKNRLYSEYVKSFEKNEKKTGQTKQDPSLKYLTQSMERVNDLLEDQIAKNMDLTKSEQLLMDLKSSPLWEGISARDKLTIEQLLQMGQLNELAVKQEKEKQEAIESVNRAKAAAQDLNFKEIEATRATVVDLINQNEATREQIGLIGAEAGATEELAKIKLKKLIASKEEYLMAKRNAGASKDMLYLLEREIELLKEQLGLIDAKTGKQSFVGMRDSVADAIVTGLFEGGKAGSQKLRDIIEAELRKPITVFIRAIVGDIMGLDASSGTGSFANTISSGSKILNNMMNFGSNLSSSVGTGALRLGDWLSTSGNNTLASAGEFLQGNYGSIGSVAGAAGNALAGVGIFKGVSNGYSISKGADIIGTLASAYFGPIGGAIAGGINSLFGRKLKDTGIQGTFSGADQFTGNTFQFYKGGLFRSNKTKLGTLDPMLASGLGQAYGGLTSANMAMANYLGINASDRLSGFRSDVKFSTQGLNEQQIQQKLQEVLGNVAEEQAKLLLGTYETVTKKGFLRFVKKTEQVWKPSEFVRFGETALEALTRLSTSLKAVNTFLSNTNTTMLAFSVAGADMASSLVDLFGGVQNFDQITGQYYQNFFTEQERLAKGQELLANAFKDLGLQVPATVTAYRQLIESQDLTTESGRQTFTSLMTLSAAFYELDTASREATATMIEEINRLRGVVQTTSTGGFEGTRASFLSAIAAAGAGDATAMASLPGLSQSLESMFAGNARSLEDVNRFRSWLANSIGSVVPAFASGGIHAGGIRLVGENGPELEVTGPSRIFSAGETAGMLGGNNVVQAIAVLNQNLELLRAEVRADVQHNAKTAKLLDRVIPEGDSIKVSNL